jgi:hypothetical protein
MQTFLPYADFARSASVLDRARLGKQRVEAKQILLALTGASRWWTHHPVTKMWSGHEGALALYGAVCCKEWINRGYKDNTLLFFVEQMGQHKRRGMPAWFGWEKFHAAHRSNLLRKDPIHYAQFNWSEPRDLPYIYPNPEEVNNGR